MLTKVIQHLISKLNYTRGLTNEDNKITNGNYSSQYVQFECRWRKRQRKPGRKEGGGQEEGRRNRELQLFKYTVTQDKIYISIHTNLQHWQKTAVRTT